MANGMVSFADEFQSTMCLVHFLKLYFTSLESDTENYG